MLKKIRYEIPAGTQPWERFAEESRDEYRLFLIYRDVAKLDRTLESAYRIDQNREYDNEAIEVPRLYAMLHRRFYWDERCLLWDNYIQRQRDEIAVREVRKWELNRQESLNRAFEISRKMLDRVEKILDSPLYETETEFEQNGRKIVHHFYPTKWSFRDAPIMFRDAVEIQSAVFAAMAPDIATATQRELEAVRDAKFETIGMDGGSPGETSIEISPG